MRNPIQIIKTSLNYFLLGLLAVIPLVVVMQIAIWLAHANAGSVLYFIVCQKPGTPTTTGDTLVSIRTALAVPSSTLP